MNIFSQLKDIIEIKSGKLLDNQDTFQDFQPYLICRWLSMYDSSVANLLSETTNVLYSGLETKEQWYKLLSVVVPECKFKYVNYIKKTKQEKEPTEEMITKLSKLLELSKREIKEMLDSNLTEKEKIKEMYK